MTRCEQCGGRIFGKPVCNGRWHKRCWEAWKAARDLFLKKAEDAVKAMPIEGSLEEVRTRAWDINKKLEELEEAATLERGCYRCGGNIDSGTYSGGIYRRTVTLAGQPCSEGSMSQTYIVCIDCQGKVFAMLDVAKEGLS